jgi:hypothetical protein
VAVRALGLPDPGETTTTITLDTPCRWMVMCWDDFDHPAAIFTVT